MKYMRVVVLASVMAGLILAGNLAQPRAAQGQQMTPVPTPPAPGQPAFPPGADFTNVWTWQSDAHQLVQQLAKAEKDEEKRELRKKLIDVLNQQFDARIEQQTKELAELEKEITRLRDVLEKRRDAKEKIVERHLEQMILDAQGMGWNAPGHPGIPGYGPMGGNFDFARPGQQRTPSAAPKAPRR